METTTQQIKTNNLVFKTSKKIGDETLKVTICLNDECKNGHQDFAITGDLYEGKKWSAGGCLHDKIIKFFPEFDIFIKLHLCDYEGIPMYAVENGFYHLRNGFSNTKPEDKNFKTEFCEYYRITPRQFDVLSRSANQLQYALNLQRLGVLDQWKTEANAAIKYLEQLTGKKFLVDSRKTQFHAPTPEQIKEEEERQNNGYYTPKAEQEREEAKQDKIIETLAAERDKEILKANTEFDLKVQVLKIGGENALKNCLYYAHSKTLSFNWKGYDMISQTIVDKIINEITLPEGVKIEDRKGK